MAVHNSLYGEVSFPPLVEALIETKPFQRLKHLAQAEGPPSISKWNIPSRFDHSIGVAHLMNLVLQINPQLNGSAPLLLAAALLHDTGNPAFCHTSEPFLFEVCGHDGESFLSELISNSDVERILDDYGITVQDVTNIVTGKQKPLSDILHGSIDVDNIDNVRRYAFHRQIKDANYDAEAIARSFRWHDDSWKLDPSCAELVSAWQLARAQVYEAIYDHNSLPIYQMLRRAMYFSYEQGLLTKEFFKLNDHNALDFLENTTPESRILVEQLRDKNYFRPVISLDDWPESELAKRLTNNMLDLSRFSDSLAEACEIPRHEICVILSLGRDYRPVTVGWTDPTYSFHDSHHNQLRKRLRVFSAIQAPEKLERVRQYVSTAFNVPVETSVETPATSQAPC